MRGEPKTQREILSSLGELPPAQPSSLWSKWKDKTLENRHVVLLFFVLSLFFGVHALVTAGRRTGFGPPAAAATTTADDSHAYHAIHFSRDRPLEVLVLNDLPPLDMNSAQWERQINQWDTQYGLVLVLTSNVRLDLIQALDAFLKSKGSRASATPSSGGSTAPSSRATWFFAAQAFAENNGRPYFPISPRMMVTCTFHALVMGHEVEILSSISADNVRLTRRLGEGQGDVNTRILILPRQQSTLPSVADALAPLSPIISVWSDETRMRLNVQQYTDPKRNREPVRSFVSTARDPCIIRPFDGSDYKWNCRRELRAERDR